MDPQMPFISDAIENGDIRIRIYSCPCLAEIFNNDIPISSFNGIDGLSAWATQKSGIHHKRKEMGRWFCRSITG